MRKRSWHIKLSLTPGLGESVLYLTLACSLPLGEHKPLHIFQLGRQSILVNQISLRPRSGNFERAPPKSICSRAPAKLRRGSPLLRSCATLCRCPRPRPSTLGVGEPPSS